MQIRAVFATIRRNPQSPAESENNWEFCARQRRNAQFRAWTRIFGDFRAEVFGLHKRPTLPENAGRRRSWPQIVRFRQRPPDFDGHRRKRPDLAFEPAATGNKWQWKEEVKWRDKAFCSAKSRGLAQAGRKGEPAVPVALSRRVFA